MFGSGRKESKRADGLSSSSSVVGSTISQDDICVVEKNYSGDNRNQGGLHSPTPSANRSIQKGKGNVDRLVGLNDDDKRLLAARKQVVFSRKKRGECLLQKGVSLHRSKATILLILLS